MIIEIIVYLRNVRQPQLDGKFAGKHQNSLGSAEIDLTAE